MFKYSTNAQFSESTKTTDLKAKDDIIHAGKEKWYPAFFHEYIDETEFKRCEEWVRKIHADKIEKLIIIGIGGSSLGGKAIYALDKKIENKLFFWEGVHNDSYKELQSFIKLASDRIGVLWVSKSGTTLETTANLSLLRQEHPGLKEYFVTSNPEKIKHLTNENSEIFKIADELGGRFSVVSPVGVLPGLFCGCDMRSFMAGYKEGLEKFSFDFDINKNVAKKIAVQYFENFSNQYQGNVFWVYNRELNSWGEWLVQLWGESIGKSKKTTVLPYLAKGPEDQHSLLQFFLDGPNSYMHTLVIADSIPDQEIKGEIEGLFSNKTLTEITKAQAQSIVRALNERERPVNYFSCESFVSKNGANYKQLGEFMAFWMFVVTYISYLFEENPFDQPAVELGKIFCKEILSGAEGEQVLNQQFEA